MELRPLGHTGVQVSKLCLGAMMFGAWGTKDHDESIRIIHRALDAGINFIDTADVYSDGESEEIVGKALAGGRRDDVVLATKVDMPMGDDPNRRGLSRRWIIREVESSLRRLNTDWIDLYQIHRPEPGTDIDETLGALSDLVHQGKVRYIGHSTFPASMIVEAQWMAERRARERFRCEQPPYSILTRAIENEVLPACQRYGMGVISYSPLAGGWLSGRYSKGGELQGPTSPARKRLANRFDLSLPENQRKLKATERLAQLADDAGISLIELANRLRAEAPSRHRGHHWPENHGAPGVTAASRGRRALHRPVGPHRRDQPAGHHHQRCRQRLDQPLSRSGGAALMRTAAVKRFTLNNGVEMPAIGLGVFQTPPEETRSAVEAALSAGYRHIDTAAAYGNERQVGEALRNSGIDRDEVFLETKIWTSDYGYDQTLHGFEKSARKLGVDQIDLLILHQPLPSDFARTVGAYQALETLLGDAKVRAIGVSNFMVDHLSSLLERASVVPAVNQIEVHPYFTQREVQAYGAARGILTQAWSPIGGITFYREGSPQSTLQDPVIGEIAQAHGRTPAQVMLRWHLQQGRSAIPKSFRPRRIAENFDIFNFELTDEDAAAIDGLDTGRRGGPEPSDINLENFDLGDLALVGSPPPAGEVRDSYAPRRRVLDAILIGAAAETGAEVREAFNPHPDLPRPWRRCPRAVGDL